MNQRAESLNLGGGIHGLDPGTPRPGVAVRGAGATPQSRIAGAVRRTSLPDLRFFLSDSMVQTTETIQNMCANKRRKKKQKMKQKPSDIWFCTWKGQGPWELQRTWRDRTGQPRTEHWWSASPSPGTGDKKKLRFLGISENIRSKRRWKENWRKWGMSR